MTATESPQWGKQSSSALAKVEAHPGLSVFGEINDFEGAQRMAAALCSSTLVPRDYQGQQNLGNCLIALDLAGALGLRPMAVMQNLHVIHGRPSFSSSFLIGQINSCGRFSPLEFVLDDPDSPTSCYAVATSKATGRELVGEKVTIAMAKAEGWWSRSGSKWPTMTGQMLRYRAAGFWQRVYAPELTSGCAVAEEVIDVEPVTVTDVAQESEPEQPKPKARTRRAPKAAEPEPTPPAAEPVDAKAQAAPPEPVEVEAPAPAPEPEAKAPIDPPAAAPAAKTAEPIDVVPLSDFAQQGLEMVVQQCHVAELIEFAEQVRGFAKAGSMTEAEGERLLAAVLTRKTHLQKPLSSFEATATIKKIQATEGLEQRFRDVFKLPSEVALADLALERQHSETVKALLAAGVS